MSQHADVAFVEALTRQIDVVASGVLGARLSVKAMSQNLNAYAARFVRSIKDECLNTDR